MRWTRGWLVVASAATIVGATAGGAWAQGAPDPAAAYATATPVKHVVVIFQENVSFDHYFGTYPVALNPPGEPSFHAAPGTPRVNGLTEALLRHNPNSANPQRLSRAQALTCDQDHRYQKEQEAFDGGLMDRFVESTGNAQCGGGAFGRPGLVMDYFDGNTVTALWNYAQHFALSDNSFGTTFGPSTPGALNLVAGQTHGVTPEESPGLTANGTVISDADPAYDDCSATQVRLAMSGRNIGDLLNARGVTWGWFQGGFQPTGRTPDGRPVCGASTRNVAGAVVADYSPHHEPFQYYRATSNPRHLPPTATAAIGHADAANHQYDLADFWAAADAGNLPAVSFLKARGAEDGHAGYSDPLDEQRFLVQTINRLERLPAWSSTVVIIAYDDSDGWYDHVMGPIVSRSDDPRYDVLAGPARCGQPAPGAALDRCGYGPRLPLLVVSPFARRNFVDHGVTDQSSIIRFIEDNWSTGRIGGGSFDELAGSLLPMLDFGRGPRTPALFLDPATGEPVSR